MHDQGLIPMPALQRWWRFRARIVPVLVLFAVVGGALLIWRAKFATAQLASQSMVCSDITSPVSGEVAELNVEPLQRVHAGGVIAKILATDPQILQASLRMIQSEIGVLRIRAQAAAARGENRPSKDWVRLELMEERVRLVMVRASMEFVRVGLAKAEELWSRGLGPVEAAEAAGARMEELGAEVEGRLERIAELEQTLASLDANEVQPLRGQEPDSLAAAIQRQEEKLRHSEAELIPVELRVDCDGTITAIHRRSGDRIVAGQPVATVTMRVPDLDAPASGDRQEHATVSHHFPDGEGEVSQPVGPPPTAQRTGPATVHRSAQASL